MHEQVYPWKRFWYPRETSIDLLDGGYLYRPETAWANRFFDGNLVPLEELAAIPCLILLGEPGLGKSRELGQQHTFTRDHLGEAVLWCDFSAYQEQGMLTRAIFDHPTFQEWVLGTGRLYLLLDGLDEGLMSIPILARFLSVEFARYRDHLARLSLRITCRTAEWPAFLENQLRELWSNAHVRAFRLAPLRREDVRAAASADGLDADRFLEEVDRKAAVPLANRPITLRFLLNLYREHGTFPSTQQALYEDGCRILCKEVSPSRRSARFTGNFTAGERLAAAARLAYLMVFTNRSEVWDGVDLADAPGGSLQLYECSGGTEDADGNPLPVSERLLAEACDTALFSSRGPDRREWAHRTYAEFLAAHHLSSHRLSLPQLMTLLFYADAGERRLIPQLHETAAWLATMQPAVFRVIMETDPEVLLKSDVATASEQDRAALVAALLALEPEERLWNVNMHLGQQYGKLLHASLGAQLASVISDPALSTTRRVVAIEISEAGRLQTLSPELVALALDPSEARLVREAAAQAVAQIGDEASKARLRPLALGEHDDDPDDELKGHSLHAIWPAHVTAEELFTALTPPKREDFIGAYRSFLLYQVVPHLKLADLPVAVQWVEQHPPRATMQGLTGEFKPLTDAIIRLALEHLDEPAVLPAVAHLASSRLLQSGLIFGLTPAEQETARWLDNDETRQRLLAALLPLLALHTSDAIVWHVAKPPLLLPRDLSWLIAFLAEASVESTQQLVARLIGRLIDSDDPAQVQTVLEASERLPFLADEVARLFRPVTLGSPEAAQMKRAWLERQQADLPQEPDQPPPPQPPPLLEHIETHLQAFEHGEYVAWSYIVQRMGTMPDDVAPGNVKVDLTASRAWHMLEEPLKMRLVEAAKQCLLEVGPDPQVWLDLDLMHYHDFALTTYQALCLVLQRGPEFLATLPREAWERLVPVILTSGLLLPDGPRDESNSTAHRRLVAAAYRYAPAELVAGIMRLLEREQWNCTSTYWNLLRSVEGAWDPVLTEALLVKAGDGTVAPECSGSLLSILLIHHLEAAKGQAEALLTLPLPTDDSQRQRALAAALALIQFADDAGWPAVWPAIESDQEFGIRLIANLAYRSNWHAHQLSEEQLADLYLWLAHRFPPTQLPDQRTGVLGGGADDISTWREGLLQQLKERGTIEACHALERIVRKTEEQDRARMQWILLEAQTLARRQMWLPYRPAYLMKVIADSRVRLVQNEEQMLEVVIESLRRLETTFRDETPAWRDVWDRLPLPSAETPTSTRRRRRAFTYRPIDENEFSDYVKRHLQADLGSKGIIANREVVIRSDERIDIRIDALSRNTREELDERLSLIIEVKGNWNPELMTAIQTQLVERYLRDNHCQHGLYLVGWFNCDAWDSRDDRKRRALRMSMEEVQRLLDEQAVSLSPQATVKALILNAAIRERVG